MASYLRERWDWKQTGWFLLALNAVCLFFLVLMKTGRLSLHGFDRWLTWSGALGAVLMAAWTNHRLQKSKEAEEERSA